MSADVARLVDGLQQLHAAKYDTRAAVLAGCARADRVLELIYDLGAERARVSREDRAAVGPLLEGSLRSIEIAIKRVATKYRSRLDTDALRKRSALQFLLDGFGDYPTQTPGKDFSEFFSHIKRFIEILDDLISKWKGRTDPEDPDSDRDEAEGLPASHTWWKH